MENIEDDVLLSLLHLKISIAYKYLLHRVDHISNFVASYVHESAASTVAAIQVVQVVRCTRAHDPWGPTSEDQVAIF